MLMEALQWLADMSAAKTVSVHTNANDALAADGLTAVPEGVEITDLECYMPRRRRPRGTYLTTDLDSFVALTQENRPFPEIPVLVQPRETRMEAVAYLNLRLLFGGNDGQGHGDHKVVLGIPAAPEYAALLKLCESTVTQTALAEFLEDYADMAVAYGADDQRIAHHKAVAAIQKVTIEGVKKRTTEEQHFRAERSGFESIEAKSDEALPAHITFECAPFEGLSVRSFGLRVSIRTGGDNPLFVLRFIRHGTILKAVGDEFVEKIRDALPGASVNIGGFSG